MTLEQLAFIDYCHDARDADRLLPEMMWLCEGDEVIEEMEDALAAYVDTFVRL